jgi:peptidoglycan/LPS O-acetylase OafA/YrhL
MDRGRFHNLDALRGVCALSVVLFHCNGFFARGSIFCHGYLAVDAFFILSGFVIAHTYEGRLAGGLRTSDFIRMRVKRLAPVYWVGTALGAVALAVVASVMPPGTFYSLKLVAVLSMMTMLLVPQLTLGGPAYPANSVAWSLAGEFVANLLYAGGLHRLRSRILLIIICLGWGAAALYGYYDPYGWCFGPRTTDVLLTPLRAIPAFLAGVVLYRAYRAGHFDRLPSVSPLVLVLTWTVLAEVPTNGPTPTFDLLVVTLVCPLLIALLVRAKEVAPAPFLWLGAISYALYASHQSLILLANQFLDFRSSPNPLEASLGVGGALALAWAIHRFVEQKPARRAEQIRSATA